MFASPARVSGAATVNVPPVVVVPSTMMGPPPGTGALAGMQTWLLAPGTVLPAQFLAVDQLALVPRPVHAFCPVVRLQASAALAEPAAKASARAPTSERAT